MKVVVFTPAFSIIKFPELLLPQRPGRSEQLLSTIQRHYPGLIPEVINFTIRPDNTR